MAVTHKITHDIDENKSIIEIFVGGNLASNYSYDNGNVTLPGQSVGYTGLDLVALRTANERLREWTDSITRIFNPLVTVPRRAHHFHIEKDADELRALLRVNGQTVLELTWHEALQTYDSGKHPLNVLTWSEMLMFMDFFDHFLFGVTNF